MVSFQEDFNNFIMKVENAEESLSLDIILKAPEGIIRIEYFKWVILTSNDTSCSMKTEVRPNENMACQSYILCGLPKKLCA